MVRYCTLVASNDVGEEIPPEDKSRDYDDMTALELILFGSLLVDNDATLHVRGVQIYLTCEIKGAERFFPFYIHLEITMQIFLTLG